MVNSGYMTPESDKMFGVSKRALKADFINIMYKMAGSPDIDADNEKQSAFKWAISESLIDKDESLAGGITYAEAAMMVYKYVKLTIGIPIDYDFAQINKLCQQYPDITREEIVAIKWCMAKNIISGEKDNTPYDTYNQTINRGQMAVYLQRMYFLSINE